MPKRWRIHVGAHKTATTHLQQIFEHQIPALAQQGLAYVPLKELRAATRNVILHRTRFPSWRFRQSVSPMSGRETLLSEENWLGEAYDACSFPPYKNAEKNLRMISSLRGKKQVFLGIRDPADFVTSAYSEALRYHPKSVIFDKVRNDWLEGGCCWTDLVSTIREFMPNIRVWLYEDYRENCFEIAETVSGRAVQKLSLPAPRETLRLSREEVLTIETEKDNLFCGRLPFTQSGRFEMFTPEERAYLNSCYDRDISNLDTTHPGVMIRFR